MISTGGNRGNGEKPSVGAVWIFTERGSATRSGFVLRKVFELHDDVLILRTRCGSQSCAPIKLLQCKTSAPSVCSCSISESRVGDRRSVDSLVNVITLHCMTTLLQTRVEHRVAQNFKRAAKLRGQTAYAYLQQIVQQAATAPKPGTWDDHWDKIAKLKLKRLPYNPVVKNREESDER